MAQRPVTAARSAPPDDGGPALDAVIVGAGFSGLYMLHRLRTMGMRAQVLERGSDVGGTWYWNRYPGARCDIESVDYQFSFSEELLAQWRWTERYATQAEILAYLNFVADRLDLRRDIEFGTEVRSASFDSSSGLWRLTTGTGSRLSARFCILAVGCLSEPKPPKFPASNASPESGTTRHAGRARASTSPASAWASWGRGAPPSSSSPGLPPRPHGSTSSSAPRTMQCPPTTGRSAMTSRPRCSPATGSGGGCARSRMRACRSPRQRRRHST